MPKTEKKEAKPKAMTLGKLQKRTRAHRYGMAKVAENSDGDLMGGMSPFGHRAYKMNKEAHKSRQGELRAAGYPITAAALPHTSMQQGDSHHNYQLAGAGSRSWYVGTPKERSLPPGDDATAGERRQAMFDMRQEKERMRKGKGHELP